MKSKELVSAEGAGISRKTNENIFSYALRTKDYKNKEVMGYDNPEQIINTDYFAMDVLRTFQRGLRSKWMVSQIEKKSCKNLDEALIVLNSSMAKQLRIDQLTGKDEISLETDKNLFVNLKSSQYYANNIN